MPETNVDGMRGKEQRQSATIGRRCKWQQDSARKALVDASNDIRISGGQRKQKEEGNLVRWKKACGKMEERIKVGKSDS